MDYEIVKLKEIADFNKESIGKNSDYDFINYLDTANITNGAIDTIVKMEINESPSRAKRIVHKNDIVYSTVRPNLCHYGILDAPVDNMIVSTGFTVISCKDNVNPYYVYNYLTQNDITSQLHSIAENSTSAYPSIKPSDLENIEIKLPKLEIQNKIAKILTDIDKKIKLNNEINNNLYEFSNSIFKKWFIQFEYPDFNGNLKESELGKIPEDWEIGYFDDSKLTSIIKSGVDKFEGTKKYVATADVTEKNITNYEEVSYNEKPSRANMTPRISSVWFAKMENSVKNILVDSYMKDILNNYIFSTGFMGVECINNSLYYIWNIINDDKFLQEKNSLSTGTLMAGISNSTIKNYKYLIPDQNTLHKFNKIQLNINKKIYNNSIQNEKLSQLRDTLLPKLMNGEIDLDNIEV